MILIFKLFHLFRSLFSSRVAGALALQAQLIYYLFIHTLTYLIWPAQFHGWSRNSSLCRLKCEWTRVVKQWAIKMLYTLLHYMLMIFLLLLLWIYRSNIYIRIIFLSSCARAPFRANDNRFKMHMICVWDVQNITRLQLIEDFFIIQVYKLS
jgi:hypothetical protein